MTTREIIDLVSATGTPVTALVGMLVVIQGKRLSRIESALKTLGAHVHPSPHCKPPALPLTLALVALLAVGCVRTAVSIGDATMTRTAILTRVSVPNLEITTNGTIRATVESDARTELLEVLARALLSAPP